MLTRCFTHLPGIGRATEKRLLEAGILCWEDALNSSALPLGEGSRADFLRGVEESLTRLNRGDALWFSERLAQAEQWRLYPHFKTRAAYVDIETSGLSWPQGQITTIALYDGEDLKIFINGRNLETFLDEIRAYDLLVTWNGRAFDVPFINRAMSVQLKMAHLDLFPVYRALGIKGGLKKVEKELGLDRDGLDGVDGFTAIQLWREYTRWGEPSALETLLAYNSEDVFSLEYLSHHACEQHGCPVQGDVEKPENPFRPDPELVARLTEERRQWQERRNRA